MKEFIKKLIGRLENHIKYCESCHEEFPNAKMSLTYEVQINAYKNAIEIVNELVEEYINTSNDTSSGYCEWQPIDEEKSIYKSVCKKQSLYDGNPTESMYEFCPYCGKKIKVVE